MFIWSYLGLRVSQNTVYSKGNCLLSGDQGCEVGERGDKFQPTSQCLLQGRSTPGIEPSNVIHLGEPVRFLGAAF